MLTLFHLKKYIIFYDQGDSRYSFSYINGYQSGIEGYKDYTHYYDNKYYITVLPKNRIWVITKVYGKKYRSIRYTFNYKINFIFWGTNFYPLSISHPIYKIFNLDREYTGIHLEYHHKRQKLNYQIECPNEGIIIILICDLNNTIEEIKHYSKGNYLNIKYHNNSIKSISVINNVEEKKYIKI